MASSPAPHQSSDESPESGQAGQPSDDEPDLDARSQQIERSLIQAGLDAATSGDFVDPLINVSVTLRNQASQHGKAGHWLCQLLADAADSLDPASVADAVGNVFADALVNKGVPQWAASTAGWGIAKAAQPLLLQASPTGQLCLGLRVLGSLVCPDLERCPAGDQLAVPLLQQALAQ